MDRIKKPRGLIRYDSEKGISQGIRSIFNTRAIAYSVFLSALLILVATLFTLRSDFETTIIRQRGTLFQEYGEKSYSNIFQIEVVNKTRKSHEVEVKMLEPNGEVVLMGGKITLKEGELGSGTFLTVLKKSVVKSSKTKIVLGVYSGKELIKEYEVTFLGPNELD